MSISHLVSLCTIRITATRKYPDGTTTGTAVMTGFFWRTDSGTFLVTNWHNVTGLNPSTNSANGSFSPTHFECECICKSEDANRTVLKSFTLPLYDMNETPLWKEHPRGRDVDVVLLPINREAFDNVVPWALNEQDFEEVWSPRVGDEGFIVGYPEGMSGALATPIWKRGSIASEPGLNFEEKPMFLFDTIGNRGLSGSPVIGRDKGILKVDGSAVGASLSDIIGTWEKFIGIYAGRLSDEGIGSQLGRVWHASVIMEILSKHYH